LTKAGKGDSRQGVSLALEGGSLSSKKEKIKALVEHIKLFDKKLLKTGDKNFSVMKKHFKAYINGWDGAKELRNKLMLTETPKEAISILTDFQKTLK
jgi:tRNA-dihydrouridine synthase